MQELRNFHIGIYSNTMLQLASSVIVALLPILYGCGSDDCEGNHSSLPLAGFYSSADPATPVSLISLTVTGKNVPNDSILLKNVIGVSQCYLPLRIDENSTTYCFTVAIDSTTSYQSNVTFDYDAKPYFVSSACGAVYNYHIKKIHCEGNLIDSVVCPGNLITNANTENLRIYVSEIN